MRTRKFGILSSRKNIRIAILMFFFLTSLWLISFSKPCLAGNIYIAQMKAGKGTGNSCENAHSIDWFNSPANWGNDAGQISPGDTVHFCGTIQTRAFIQGSGLPDKPMTFLFEPDAKFSAPTWGSSDSAAINASAKEYFIIDGGNSGIIECTDNGTLAGNKYSPSGESIENSLVHTRSDNTYGIGLRQCGNFEIRNLIIKGIYRRVPKSNDSKRNGRGIWIASTKSNGLIHHNTISDAYFGIYIYASSSNADNIQIHDNHLSNNSTAIAISLTGKANITNATIHGNTITGGGETWQGCWGCKGYPACPDGKGSGYTCEGGDVWMHCDGIHTWGNYPDHHLALDVFNNRIQGSFGTHTTSSIFITDFTTPVRIFNNVVDGSKFTGAQNGLIDLISYGNNDYKIYNNTLIGTGNALRNNAIYLSNRANTQPTVDIKNNIITDCYIGIYDNQRLSMISSDYNLFYNNAFFGRIGSTWYRHFSDWQVSRKSDDTLIDRNSLNRNPCLTNDYSLSKKSPARDKGLTLDKELSCINGKTCVDITKNIRPYNLLWDIGAYEYTIP